MKRGLIVFGAVLGTVLGFWLGSVLGPCEFGPTCYMDPGSLPGALFGALAGGLLVRSLVHLHVSARSKVVVAVIVVIWPASLLAAGSLPSRYRAAVARRGPRVVSWAEGPNYDSQGHRPWNRSP